MRHAMLATALLALLAQSSEVPKAINPQVAVLELIWDAPTTNVDGSPLTDLKGYEVAISLAGKDLNGADEPLAKSEMVIGEAFSLNKDSLLDLPDGEYLVWVRAVDEANNKSEWSDPLALPRLDTLNPGKPTGVKLIRVTITTAAGSQIVYEEAQ